MTNLPGRKLSPRRAICKDYTNDVCELAAINGIEINGTKVYVPASQKYAVPSITNQPTLEKCRWPQSEGCIWYENCLDRFNDCKNSSDEYAISFGKLYCEKYAMNLFKFSESGQDWIGHVRQCLQSKISKLVGTSISCKDLKTRAFDSHPDCYFSSSPYHGFCSLPVSDWCHVAFTVGDALFKPGAAKLSWENAGETIKKCGKFKVEQFARLVNDAQTAMKAPTTKAPIIDRLLYMTKDKIKKGLDDLNKPVIPPIKDPKLPLPQLGIGDIPNIG